MPWDSLVGAHRDDHCICANILLVLLPTRVGSVKPHALKNTNRRKESTLQESSPVHAEAAHLQSSADSCA